MQLEPNLSVVIPTYNRAELLRRVLESYAPQSLPQDDYEIIVVDDGSTDHTAEVCHELRAELPLSYVRIAHHGIATAKNAGVAAARGNLILFADDDDIADRHLLSSHLAAHREHPEHNVAILGYTTWHPELPVTPLMHYVSEVGQFLFAYPRLLQGDVLDFRYFWGGRTSAARSLFTQDGGFDTTVGRLDDIEFGYRLSRFGLRVIFDRRSVRYMARPIAYDGFCLRCEQVGSSLMLLRRLHATPVIDAYARTIVGNDADLLDTGSAADALEEVECSLERLSPRALKLERDLASKEGRVAGHYLGRIQAWAQLRLVTGTVHRLYAEAFRLSVLKGALRSLVVEDAA